MNQDWYLLLAAGSVVLSAAALWQLYRQGRTKTSAKAKNETRVERIRARPQEPKSRVKEPAKAPAYLRAALWYGENGSIVAQARRINISDRPVFLQKTVPFAWGEYVQSLFALKTDEALMLHIIQPSASIKRAAGFDQFGEPVAIDMRLMPAHSASIARFFPQPQEALSMQLQSLMRRLFFTLAWPDQLRYLRLQSRPINEQFSLLEAFDDRATSRQVLQCLLASQLLQPQSYQQATRLILMQEALRTLRKPMKEDEFEGLWTQVLALTFEKKQIAVFYLTREEIAPSIGNIV